MRIGEWADGNALMGECKTDTSPLGTTASSIFPFLYLSRKPRVVGWATSRWSTVTYHLKNKSVLLLLLFNCGCVRIRAFGRLLMLVPGLLCVDCFK